MSRRKQSNPKPLKAGEEEEWGSEGEAEVKRANTPSCESKSPPPPAAASPASAREESSTPKLRLNPSLATDPAVRSAQGEGEPVDVEYLSNALPLHSALAAGRFFCLPPLPADYIQPRIKTEAAESKQANVPVYTCAPCGIRFSSLSTLEAHQTYYCSHRHSTGSKSAATGGAESEAEDLKPTMESREDVSGGESSTSEPAPKTIRSGKQYRCPHCSYSADKKVSLNRHMRMHSSSPASQTSVNQETPEAFITSLHLVDRFCQDCDIRFSSLKTFRAHKLHYCSTRHVIKTNKPSSAPSSPTDSRTTPTSPGASDTSSHPQQPFLALPTNPALIIPYTLFQGASILPASTVIGQDTVYTLLPDGTLQPIAQGVLGHGRFPQHLSTESGKSQRPPAVSEAQVPKVSEESHVKTGPSEGSKPLDLSCRRSIEHELEMEEDEKENRRSVDNHINIFPSPDPEDIICAPSIPLMLSTSSTCSSPSPAPVSPALSSSSYSTGARRSCVDTKRQRLDSQSNSPSPKSSIPDMKSPHRTPNGLASAKTMKNEDSKRKTPGDNTPPKTESHGNLNISNLLLAAAQSHHIDISMKPEISNLPFPSELLSQLSSAISTRAVNKSNKPVGVPGLIPAAGIPLLVPQQLTGSARPPSELINPATILPLLTSEMALRFAAASASEIPTVQVPQVLVKQGVSKCQECNIVFCKHENYVAHKKHYCSARQMPETQSAQEETSAKSISPTAPTSPPVNASSPVNSKEKAPSPVSAPSSVNISVASTSKPTLYQFICAACGIKFTSYDNLTAHQMYYCPKRVTTETDKSMRRCPKCKVNVPTDQLSNHQCGGLVSGWKCPCCPVISPTASAAQKHMDTHSSVKAFLCTICRYKGNTLRGMRTHIRMHFEKRSTEIMEENYITCVLEDGSGGKIEVTPGDHEDNSTMKSADDSGSCNGESIRIKEEIQKEVEEDEEYIEVEELNTVKSEPLPIITESESRTKQTSPNDKRKKSNPSLPGQWCSNKRLNGCNEVLTHDARGPIVL